MPSYWTWNTFSWPGPYLLPFEINTTPYTKSTHLLWFLNTPYSIILSCLWTCHSFHFIYQVIFLRLNTNITSFEVWLHSKNWCLSPLEFSLSTQTFLHEYTTPLCTRFLALQGQKLYIINFSIFRTQYRNWFQVYSINCYLNK